jgi:nicotinate-nucleotide adenylyltransferase
LSRVVVFGGTFDPPHIAHLIHAQYAAEVLDCPVLFTPAGDPPHKHGETRTPAQHRLAMTAIAIEGNARFRLSRVDVDRPGPHYTADMLALLQGEAEELYLLIGADSLRDLPTWNRPAEVVQRARLLIAPRPDVTPDVRALEQTLPGLRGRVHLLDAPGLDVSSTVVAARIAAGRTVRYLVPEAVLAYIQVNRLYER